MNITRFIGKIHFLSPERKLALYPPFRAMGVRVLEYRRDPVMLRLKLPLNWRSRNSGGSMFGGWQTALADPIAPMACLMAFDGVHVWTRKLEVDFRRPGNSDLELRFEMSPARRAGIAAELTEKGRADPVFEYGLYRADGELCSQVHCTVAIRPEGYRPKKR